MINISNLSDGESKSGKQLLYMLTIGVTIIMFVYYHNQIKLSKMKIEEMKNPNSKKMISKED